MLNMIHMVMAALSCMVNDDRLPRVPLTYALLASTRPQPFALGAAAAAERVLPFANKFRWNDAVSVLACVFILFNWEFPNGFDLGRRDGLVIHRLRLL